MLVRQAIQDCGLSRAQIARDAGLSEDALFAWLKGARAPRPESLQQLASGLRKRGAELTDLAEQIEKAATEGDGLND